MNNWRLCQPFPIRNPERGIRWCAGGGGGTKIFISELDAVFYFVFFVMVFLINK